MREMWWQFARAGVRSSLGERGGIAKEGQTLLQTMGRPPVLLTSRLMDLGVRALGRDTHYPVFRRHFHAYGVGFAKSGTTSLALMPHRKFRTQHESDQSGLVAALAKYAAGASDAADAGDTKRAAAAESGLLGYLERADQKKGSLEVDVNFVLALALPQLLKLYPRAKFVLTLRDPLGAVDSQLRYLDHVAKSEVTMRNAPGTVDTVLWNTGCSKALWQWMWGSVQAERANEERALQRAYPDSWPLPVMLRWWCSHTLSVLDRVPPRQLLVVRTDALSKRVTADEIAHFLGAQAADVNPSHGFRTPHKTTRARPLSLVPTAHLQSVLDRELRLQPRCADALHKYFPDDPWASDAAAWIRKASRA